MQVFTGAEKLQGNPHWAAARKQANRPPKVRELERGYEAMTAKQPREAEALAWAEVLLNDLD